jgi:hypothetical protein
VNFLRGDAILFWRHAQGFADECSSLQIDVTEGTNSPGGAPDYLAPEVLSQIEALADGVTALLDNHGNDVWASGLVGWKLAAADHDAMPFAGNLAAGARHPWPRQAAGMSAQLHQVVESGTTYDRQPLTLRLFVLPQAPPRGSQRSVHGA